MHEENFENIWFSLELNKILGSNYSKNVCYNQGKTFTVYFSTILDTYCLTRYAFQTSDIIWSKIIPKIVSQNFIFEENYKAV